MRWDVPSYHRASFALINGSGEKSYQDNTHLVGIDGATYIVTPSISSQFHLGRQRAEAAVKAVDGDFWLWCAGTSAANT